MAGKLIGRLAFLVKTLFPPGIITLLCPTRFFAFFQCFEIVSISTTTTIEKPHAATAGLIEVKSRDTSSAESCLFLKVTHAHTRLFAIFQSAEFIVVSSATTVGELLALSVGLIKVIHPKMCSAGSCLRWKTTYTCIFAFFRCFEIISISTATTVKKPYAATAGLIEIESRDTSSAESCIAWEDTHVHTL